MGELPKPYYQPNSSDPAWLVVAVQFHGHLGPWAVAGIRSGMAGVQAIEAKGYFDVEVTCQGPLAKPPRSCFLDGLQVGTGATMGKRNLRWVEAEEILVIVKNTRTGRRAEVRPTARLLEMVGLAPLRSKAETTKQGGRGEQDKKAAEEALEALARQIGALPDKEILSVKVLGP